MNRKHPCLSVGVRHHSFLSIIRIMNLRLFIQNLTLLTVLGFFLTGTLGCRLFLPMPQEKEPETTSKLKSFTDHNFSLFLSHGPDPGVYEFVVCDQDSVAQEKAIICQDNSCTDKVSIKPPYCTSAFRGAPLKTFCSNYSVLKKYCPTLPSQKENCAKPAAERETPYTAQFCSQLPLIESACEPVNTFLSQTCEPLHNSEQACEESGSFISAPCRKHSILQDQRKPFLLYDKEWGPPERLALMAQINFEQFLKFHHSKQAKFWHGIATGSIFAFYTQRTWNQIMKLIPNAPVLRRKASASIPITKNKKLDLGVSIRDVLGFSVIGGAILINPVTTEYDYLTSFFGYSLEGRCLLKMATGYPGLSGELPYFVEDEEFSDTIVDAALPVSSGLGANLIVGRATAKAHPTVALGSLMVLPFLASQISSFTAGDKDLKKLMANFDDLLSPSPEIPDHKQAKNKVGDITKILPILGRSLLFTEKAGLSEVDQFCVPYKKSGQWTPLCRSIWQGKEGNMRSFFTKRNNQAKDLVPCEEIIKNPQ